MDILLVMDAVMTSDGWMLVVGRGQVIQKPTASLISHMKGHEISASENTISIRF